jgi:hypothetical protein
MGHLHPSIEKHVATAPTGAVAAAIGRDRSLTTQLELLAGIRLSVCVKDQPRNVTTGRWDDCTEAVLDMLSSNIAAAFMFLKVARQGRRLAFFDLCRERKWHFERAMILRSDSVFHHGEAFIIPWISMTEADNIAYAFNMPAILYLRRGRPVRLLVTG